MFDAEMPIDGAKFVWRARIMGVAVEDDSLHKHLKF